MFTAQIVRSGRFGNRIARYCGVGQPSAFPTNTYFSSESSSSNDGASSSTDTASEPNDRLHSTDIAFKPNKSGWGYTKTYKSNFQDIFKKKKKSEDEDAK